MRPDQQQTRKFKTDRSRDGKRDPRAVSRDRQRKAARAAKRAIQGR